MSLENNMSTPTPPQPPESQLLAGFRAIVIGFVAIWVGAQILGGCKRAAQNSYEEGYHRGAYEERQRHPQPEPEPGS
jgi:hypothetical protein